MQSTLDQTLIGLIPVAFGFFLGFFVERIAAWIGTRAERKNQALRLGYEIESIRQIAEKSIKENKPTIENTRKLIESGKLASITILDADLPTHTYMSSSFNLNLFDESIAASIAECYRWVDYVRNTKRLNQKLESEVTDMIKLATTRTLNTSEANFLGSRMLSQLAFAEQYLLDLNKIRTMANEAMTGLKKYCEFDTSKVKVSATQVRHEEYPPIDTHALAPQVPKLSL